MNNRVTSRDQGWEAGALVRDIIRWWKLHANWLRRSDGGAAISQPTEVSDSWKRAGERKRAALCPYLAVLSEWLPSLTDRVDAALHVRNVVTISLDNLVRKNNTLHHYPTPYPRSTAYQLAPIWLQALTSKYSNCISSNFLFFCPICMKFSHNILHTYSFILSIIRHN